MNENCTVCRTLEDKDGRWAWFIATNVNEIYYTCCSSCTELFKLNPLGYASYPVDSMYLKTQHRNTTKNNYYI